MPSKDPSLIIDRILNRADPTAATELELLNSLSDTGSPILELRRLLQSDKPEAVEAGAWVLAELGVKARPLIDEIPNLLQHTSARVRYFALDALTALASPADGAVLAQGIGLFDDAHSGVRKKVLRILTGVTLSSLASALRYLPLADQESLAWLVRTGTDQEYVTDVMARMKSQDQRTRRYAVAAAARMAPKTDVALRLASDSFDSDIKAFALLELAAAAARRGELEVG